MRIEPMLINIKRLADSLCCPKHEGHVGLFPATPRKVSSESSACESGMTFDDQEGEEGSGGLGFGVKVRNAEGDTL